MPRSAKAPRAADPRIPMVTWSVPYREAACTPGIIVTAWALLQRIPAPTEAETREALAGNLCRCTGYDGILRAVVQEKSP